MLPIVFLIQQLATTGIEIYVSLSTRVCACLVRYCKLVVFLVSTPVIASVVVQQAPKAIRMLFAQL